MLSLIVLLLKLLRPDQPVPGPLSSDPCLDPRDHGLPTASFCSGQVAVRQARGGPECEASPPGSAGAQGLSCRLAAPRM